MVNIWLIYFVISICLNNSHIGKIVVRTNHTLVRDVILQSDLLIVGCGNIAYADGYRFTLANSDSSIIGIIRCPDGYGENFFIRGTKYKVKLTNDHITDSLKNYSLMDPYEKHNYPTYLITEINKE